MTDVQRLVANGESLIRFMREYIDDTEAKDLTVEWIEEDDSITTSTLPNALGMIQEGLDYTEFEAAFNIAEA